MILGSSHITVTEVAVHSVMLETFSVSFAVDKEGNKSVNAGS